MHKKNTHIHFLNKKKEKNKTLRPVYTQHGPIRRRLVQQTVKTSGAAGQNAVLSVTHNADAALNYVCCNFPNVLMPWHAEPSHGHMHSCRFNF